MKNLKMKKIFSAIILSGLMLASCDFQHPVPNVLPDPVFDVRGLQEYDAISIYEEVPVDLSFSRVFGVSKEITINLAVDESLLTEHNTLYASNYTLMPEEYYECPESVVFYGNIKKDTMTVKVFVDKLVKEKGLEAANNMIIPVRMAEASMDVEDAASAGNVLIKMNIDTPKIEVNVPETKSLEFISAFPLTQTVQIAADANFTTLDTKKVSVVADETKVAAFNTANGTSHVILPAASYEIKGATFDKETKQALIDVVFDCASLSDANTYILPLVMKQDGGYELTQDNPIYVVVSLTELKISVVGGGELVQKATAKGSMTASINSPITSDFAINFKYEPSKVAEYNAAHGTSYGAPDASKVKVTASAITAGELEGTVDFEIDWADKPYDDGELLLLPLTLDGIKEGTQIVGETTVYVELTKTLTGNWTVEAIEPMKPAAVNGTWTALVGSTIWLADGKTPVNGVTKPVSNDAEAKQKYVFVYGGGWTDGLLYFNIDFENEIADKPGCYPIVDMRDRPDGNDTVTPYNCYFDATNEEFHWDFTVTGYWSPGGPGGSKLQDASHVPGEAKYGRMHSKQ